MLTDEGRVWLLNLINTGSVDSYQIRLYQNDIGPWTRGVNIASLVESDFDGYAPWDISGGWSANLSSQGYGIGLMAEPFWVSVDLSPVFIFGYWLGSAGNPNLVIAGNRFSNPFFFPAPFTFQFQPIVLSSRVLGP